ncbi:MAG TPA: hypothetical protein VHY20_00395, partial [Pirellulales bacterium]|nr:hypothetical protein [Pirellulales bacterium]
MALCAFTLASLGLWLAASEVQARGRGGSSQAAQQQQKAMQAQIEYNKKVAAAQQKKDKELMDRFDLNK